jgi:hypothetical protein
LKKVAAKPLKKLKFRLTSTKEGFKETKKHFLDDKKQKKIA